MNSVANRPSSRFVNLVDKAGDFSLVEVNSGQAPTFYIVSMTKNDWHGASFMLEKQDEHGTVATYHVFTGSDEAYPTCDCPDACFRQRECKHLKAVRALQARGKLPGFSIGPCGALAETGRRFRPGRDDEPRQAFRSAASAARHCPEAFYPDGWEYTSNPDDAA